MLLLIPLPGPLCSRPRGGEPGPPGRGSGMGPGQGRGFFTAPRVNIHPALVWQSELWCVQQCSRSASAPGQGVTGLISSIVVYFLRGGCLGDQQGRGAALSPAGRDRTGLPGGGSSGAWGHRGRPCPFPCPRGGSRPPPLPFPGPARRCGSRGGRQGAQPGRGLRSGSAAATPESLPAPRAWPRALAPREGKAELARRCAGLGMGGCVRVLIWGRGSRGCRGCGGTGTAPSAGFALRARDCALCTGLKEIIILPS